MKKTIILIAGLFIAFSAPLYACYWSVDYFEYSQKEYSKREIKIVTVDLTHGTFLDFKTKKNLDSIATWSKLNPHIKFEMTTYLRDPDMDRGRVMKVAKDQSLLVIRYLISKDIDPDNVQPDAYGYGGDEKFSAIILRIKEIGERPITPVVFEDTQIETMTGSLNEVSVYPNPTVDRTTVSFHLSDPADVRLELYDMHGRLVRVVKSTYEMAGRHRYQIERGDLQSQVYLVKLNTGTNMITQKVSFM